LEEDNEGFSVFSPAVTMAEIQEGLNHYFCLSADNNLPPDILSELESILRLHSLSPQELFYKWESYSLKMGAEETKLGHDTVRMFKKDVQDGLEREHRSKHATRTDRRSGVAPTPRGAASDDVFGM
jgi:DNA polymerase alpha subunit B